MMDFSLRNTETELMDNPMLDKEKLAEVFRDIDRANSFLGGNNITIKAVRSILKDYADKELTLLDVGCGGGSMLRTLAKYCRKENIKLNLIGVDLNEQALVIAKERSLKYPEIRYQKKDILSLTEEDIRCDILLCTLTLHHFDNEEISFFIKKFAAMASIAVVINDLQRSKWAYYLFKVFSTIFIRTPIAKNDGLISIQSGFVMQELKQLSSQLPGIQHSIRPKWAFRYAWVMRKDHLKKTNE